MGKCTVRSDWLTKTDKNGHSISIWANRRSDSQTELFCKFCSCSINVCNKGFHALEQHAASDKHKKNISAAVSLQQLHFTNELSQDKNAGAGTSQRSSVKLYSVRDAASTAELVWTMKAVVSNYSFASCSDIADVLHAMAPGSLPEGFTLSPQKMRYLITDALAPYFHEQMLQEAQASWYTLSYDETSNVENMKELQVRIKYWSEHHKQVLSSHLGTCFIGRADADTLRSKILDMIHGGNLPLDKLLMVGCDGPNVNKKVVRLLNQDILLVRKKSLVDIGTCSIHTIHNAYLRGLKQLGEDGSELIVCVYRFFDGWPSRWEVYEKIQEELNLPSNKFMKHSSTRWLTFASSASRLIEQWEGIISYFLQHIPQKEPSLMSNTCYKTISKLLKVSTMKAEIYFGISSSELFTKFTGIFQRDEPLVHVLHTEMWTLLQSLLGRIVKSSVVMSLSISAVVDVKKLFVTNNLLPLKDIVCSAEVTNALSQLPEKDVLPFRKLMQKHYISACVHIIEKTPISSKLLKSLQCLQPTERLLERSSKRIVTIGKALPFDVPQDVLQDEWKLIQLEHSGNIAENQRIDHYWRHFLYLLNSSGAPKYPTVAKVVKACLTLSHGNADLERGFSVSRWALTEDRSSMKERMLNSLLIIKDTLSIHNNAPHHVPITESLLKYAQTAHRRYKDYLEEQKRAQEEDKKKKEEEERLQRELKEREKQLTDEKKSIEDLEASLEKKKKMEDSKHQAAKVLFTTATQCLSKGIKNNNMQEIHVAHAMLEGIKSAQQDEETAKQEADSIQKKSQQKERCLDY